MDTTGSKVCSGVAMLLSALFFLYELRWIEDIGTVFPMFMIGAAVFLCSLAVFMLALKQGSAPAE
jgi:hypothetical protein